MSVVWIYITTATVFAVDAVRNIGNMYVTECQQCAVLLPIYPSDLYPEKNQVETNPSVQYNMCFYLWG